MKEKLVRDNIPDIMLREGQNPMYHITRDDDEFDRRLVDKLHEEVEEFANADSSEQEVEELADILEVIGAICKFRGIDPIELERAKQEKFLHKGGFEERIVLENI
jgi:predicted house-cleaning noncanonical NTP pyrophosphatase (MazG superfamily)